MGPPFRSNGRVGVGSDGSVPNELEGWGALVDVEVELPPKSDVIVVEVERE
jgi:hypothetical protein